MNFLILAAVTMVSSCKKQPPKSEVKFVEVENYFTCKCWSKSYAAQYLCPTKPQKDEHCRDRNYTFKSLDDPSQKLCSGYAYIYSNSDSDPYGYDWVHVTDGSYYSCRPNSQPIQNNTKEEKESGGGDWGKSELADESEGGGDWGGGDWGGGSKSELAEEFGGGGDWGKSDEFTPLDFENDKMTFCKQFVIASNSYSEPPVGKPKVAGFYTLKIPGGRQIKCPIFSTSEK